MTHGNATNGSVPWVGENIEPDKGYWIAHSIQYRGGPGTIDIDHPWLAAKDNPRVQPVNCSCAQLPIILQLVHRFDCAEVLPPFPLPALLRADWVHKLSLPI